MSFKGCIWWKCERCGKLIPYMADFCRECADKLLGEPSKPFDPQAESEKKMTNKEKFEEVFGLPIDDYPINICRIIDQSVCENNICTEDCPAFKFWDREFIGRKEQ